MATQGELEKFDFLRKLAIELGAADAKVIPASKVAVEDRVVLKCKMGCNNYGKTLACPPYTPTPVEFRKIVSEYSFALFMKFKSKAEADEEAAKYLSRAETDPTVPQNVKERVQNFWLVWNDEKKKLLRAVVSLEKEAMSKGYSFAIGFVSGSCPLCEKCNVETKICLNPTMMRYSEEGVGVAVKKTANNAGISMTVPFDKNPESFALLLID
jgi:predicted metal-binding protein